MKAKMPPGQKVPEKAEYLCEKCELSFFFTKASQLRCPNCGNINVTSLVPIYVENHPLEDEMYTEDDFGQGD